MKKIKVLRIIARLNIGGPAIHTILLTEGLDINRFESILACGIPESDEGDMSYYAREKNVGPRLIPELKRELNIINDIRTFLKIFLMIKKESPDIIHTHTAKAGALGRTAGVAYNIFRPFKKKIKLIHTFHGHVFVGYFGGLKSRIFIYLERILASLSSKVITVSDSVKKELLRLRIGTEDKIRVIPLGFELDKFLRISDKQSQDLRVGIIGRLVPIKNHGLFLQSVKKVLGNNQTPTLKFIVVGDGELKVQLCKLASDLDLNDHLEFLGWQKDLTVIYSTLDLVILTSLNEGTPVSLIEAMASGRAVISSDVGGVRDLLGTEDSSFRRNDFRVFERGILVGSAKSLDFAAAITFLLKDGRLRKQMGSLGREFVRHNFSKERLIKDIENLYRDVL